MDVKELSDGRRGKGAGILVKAAVSKPMKLILIAAPLLLQLVVPVGLLAWLARGAQCSRAGLIARTAFVTMYLLVIGLAAVWLVLPSFLPALYLVLLIIVIVRSVGTVRVGPRWPRSMWGWAGVAAPALGAVILLGIALTALAGRRAPERATLELAFPLGTGRYTVVHGGSEPLVNPHLRAMEGERFRSVRGQGHALDLVALNAWGARARGLLPADPAAYEIFGDPVGAPCSGVVVRAVDGRPDLSPPLMDPINLAGNHVILDCEGAWVLLAHLQEGSIAVDSGAVVRLGTVLGRVGNSGNTSEPHLHVHAQRPGTAEAPLSGEPIPIRFDGRYLARNARVVAAARR